MDFYKYTNIDINNYNITDNFMYSLCENIIFRDYKNSLIKKNILKIINSSHNLNSLDCKYIPKFIELDDDNLKKYNSIKCSICLNNISINNVSKTKCDHFFCFTCLSKCIDYKINNCPLCKSNIHKNKITKLVQTNYNYNNNKIISLVMSYLKKNAYNVLFFKDKDTYENFKNIDSILKKYNFNFKLIHKTNLDINSINYKKIESNKNKLLNFLIFSKTDIFNYDILFYFKNKVILTFITYFIYYIT